MNTEEPIVFAVDDDPSMREALSRLFRSIGMRARIFASAEEFLAFSRPDAPACLGLEVRLPGLSGLELQRKLADVAIPIIFITGHGDIPMSLACSIRKLPQNSVPLNLPRKSALRELCKKCKLPRWQTWSE